jgi:4-hydroxyphenylpyruvate dioxygenase-like putative hemolysin
VPKIVYEVCTKVLRSLQAGEYHADHVAAAFYNPEKPVFTSPFYFHLLGLVQHQDFVVSVDETALNTPIITSEQINLKIKSYKVRHT